jgi:putative ABC transport system substrate-binding protein
MRRREFITLLGGAAAAWPLTAWAQQKTMAVVGFLHPSSPQAYASLIPAFLNGLGEAGYVEGQNLIIEYRWAEDQYDRLPALAAELVSQRVNVIATANATAAALAAKGATSTIPIVFTIGADPVQFGLVASFNRPGGNVTGVSFLSNVLVAKQLELLREFLPAASELGLLVTRAIPMPNLTRNRPMRLLSWWGVKSMSCTPARNETWTRLLRLSLNNMLPP